MKYLVAIVLVCILACNIYTILTNNNKELTVKVDSLFYKVDSLKSKSNSIRDSIIQIDTTITYINNFYEKSFHTILTQPTDSDCVYFSEYLSSNFK
jgi:hypothetical protein